MNSNLVLQNQSIKTQFVNANLSKRFLLFLDVSQKTTYTYRYALKQLFDYFKINGIQNPTHEDILNFKKYLHSRNLKAATISLYLAATRRFFLWLEQEGLYQNITLGIKGAKQDRMGHKKDFLTAKMIKNALDGINDKRDFAIFALAATCGLRTIEISRANIEDLRTLGDCTVLYVQGKGRADKSEFVKIPKPVYKAIRDYLSERGQVKGNEPLFISLSNRNLKGRLTTRRISGIIKQAMQKAGYNSPRLTAHSLRHSAVTIALMAGLSIHEVSAFARHSSIATTQIYSHEINRLYSQCENEVARAIFG